jgi:predicted transposase YbfD/YdcC
METLSFHSHIKHPEDPRQDYKIDYPLDEIMLLTICAVIASSREIAGKTGASVRFYISSTAMDAQAFAAARAHRGIENNLHRVLDVTFRDYDCRVREDDGPMNFSIIKHMAINLLKRARATVTGKGLYTHCHQGTRPLFFNTLSRLLKNPHRHPVGI